MKDPPSPRGVPDVPQPVTRPPGDLVRAGAKRRGGHYTCNADHYAAQAERLYGRGPLHGEELRIVFDDVFGHADERHV